MQFPEFFLIFCCVLLHCSDSGYRMITWQANDASQKQNANDERMKMMKLSEVATATLDQLTDEPKENPMNKFDELREATERSTSHNEIVHIALSGIRAQQPYTEKAVAELREIAEESNLEFDWVCNGDIIECWSYDESNQGNGNMARRVHLDCES